MSQTARLAKLEAKMMAQKKPLRDDSDLGRVRAATDNAVVWAMLYTKTYNPHWQVEGRPGGGHSFKKNLPDLSTTPS